MTSSSLLKPRKRLRCLTCLFNRSKPSNAPAPVDGATWVPLTRGHFALVDNEDMVLLAPYRWRVSEYAGLLYARGSLPGSHRSIAMHRLITNTPEDLVVDHIDGNGLNNRRANLRVCTLAQNVQHGLRRKPGAVGLRGVTRMRNKFTVTISATFDTAEEAARAYDHAATVLHGEFAVTNFGPYPDLLRLARGTR